MVESFLVIPNYLFSNRRWFMDKPKEITRECKKHGETLFVLEGRGYYRCKKCRVEAVSAKRRNLKVKAIEYKGGKCERCGYSKYVGALEFHHLDPTKKDFSIGHGSIKSWARTKEELDKCIMLCSNCHKEVHHEERLE